jgi:hypothetical protein
LQGGGSMQEERPFRTRNEKGEKDEKEQARE